jgi:hypothetical protein
LARAERNAITGPTPRNRGARLSAANLWLRLFRLAIPLETWGLLRSLLNFSAAASLQDWRATGNGLQALAFAYLTFGS